MHILIIQENVNQPKKLFPKCRDPGSNRGPLDLQSNALPTELSRLNQIRYENFVTSLSQIFCT